jgi:hypothetical protein
MVVVGRDAFGVATKGGEHHVSPLCEGCAKQRAERHPDKDDPLVVSKMEDPSARTQEENRADTD